MAAINNIIQMLTDESFRCTIWYLISIYRLVHYASHYFNCHPVKLLTEAHKEQGNACNDLPISLHFNEKIQVSNQGFKQKGDSFLLLSASKSVETFHLLKFLVLKIP